MKRKWQRFLHLQDKKYHIFASYCQDDGNIVRELLQYFEKFNCFVYDPETLIPPGSPILRESVDQGMEKSKVTVLFITKRFLADEFCGYLANQAIWKYITTRGSHRVFPVILEPCKVPRYLKVLNCIHVWKYVFKSGRNIKAHQLIFPVQVFHRLTKSITEPPPKFRRIQWNGVKTLTWTKNLVENVKKSVQKDKAYAMTQSKINLLKFWQFGKALEHCYINCRYNHCTFACSGRDFCQFLNHMTICRYRPVKCPNRGCLSYQPKWTVKKHLEECEFSKVTCPSERCGKKILKRKIKNHLLQCPQNKFPCNNHGCGENLTHKEADVHAKTCQFAYVSCDKCGDLLKKQDLKEHEKVCVKIEIICIICMKKILREQESSHSENCQMAKITCPNGCSEEMERWRLHDHKSECLHEIVSCQNARNGCNFEDKRFAIRNHHEQCPFKISKCDFCCDFFMVKEEHWKNCQKRHLICKCEHCGDILSRSELVLRNHDKICPVKKLKYECGISKSPMPNENLTEEQQQSVCLEKVASIRQTGLMGSGKCPSKNIGGGKADMPKENETNGDCNGLHLRHAREKCNSTSSDEQETDSMEAFVALMLATEDLTVTPRKNNNEDLNSKTLSTCNGCANSRKTFRKIMNTATSFKDIVMNRHTSYDGSYINIRPHIQHD